MFGFHFWISSPGPLPQRIEVHHRDQCIKTLYRNVNRIPEFLDIITMLWDRFGRELHHHRPQLYSGYKRLQIYGIKVLSQEDSCNGASDGTTIFNSAFGIFRRTYSLLSAALCLADSVPVSSSFPHTKPKRYCFLVKQRTHFQFLRRS